MAPAPGHPPEARTVERTVVCEIFIRKKFDFKFSM